KSFCVDALSCAKPLRTFAGNAHLLRIVLRKTAVHFCWKCLLVARIVLRKTAAHFCWKCSEQKCGAARMEPLFCNYSAGSDRAEAAGDEDRCAFLNAIIEIDGILVDHADAT